MVSFCVYSLQGCLSSLSDSNVVSLEGTWKQQITLSQPWCLSSSGPLGSPWRSRARQRAIQESLKCSIDFWSYFGSTLGVKMAPQSIPNVTKSRKKQPKHAKYDFLKMSTSRTRNNHFQGSKVPKTLPKSTKVAPKVYLKSHRFLHRF